MTPEEFWPYYISQHMRKGTRRLHFAGTTAALACVPPAVLNSAWWGALALVLGYGCAWIGHFFVEKNKPATFGYAWLSFRSDFRMYRLMWLGKMEEEMARLMPQIRKHLP
jgi:hypothetical protein